MKKRINFELSQELFKKAVKKAKKEEMTISFLLRKFLRDYTKENKWT